MEIFILILSGFLSGIFGSLGVGGGGVLIAFLTFFLEFSYKSAAGLNLLSFIPIALFSVIIYIKQNKVDLKKAFLMIVSGLVGAPIGVILNSVIDTSIISKILGAFFIAISIKSLFFESTDKS